ncbi:DUF4268 domain-containing protein [Flavobacterium humidisoli]|jgi:hypothetical protein|uniref:DUF4268 domain-containing protein n=1 Tax=Flavobacterium humidisoli TaxID=2937442 RepID=A0ABY4LNF5_9FLAO|nr:DUF4268 domain-containing protein [Flavobacterium humidisoli]UPZ13754.1 DUF4268 domain-containing protein [Flavobacterium humidisoli]
MYSREESQRIKREFWVAFAEKYPRKWVLYDTKIKDFSFKFYVDNKKAQVLIDIEQRSDEKRYAYFEKLEALKNILEEEFIKDLVFEKNYTLESGKNISRIWVEKLGVGFSNKNTWDTIFDFFNENMHALEMFYLEYDEFIKDVDSL